LRPGDYIDERFCIERQVGQGGMGVVYRALDQVTGHRVAVKMFLGKAADDVARARREAMAVALLDHPNIVKYVAHGFTRDGRLWLAMEWLEGSTLADRIDRVGLSVAEAVEVAKQVARALGTAHDAGLLHRDVKPTNVILVGGDPKKVKLIDFGVARFGAVATSLTLTGTAMGTPGYMAPEQVRGRRDLTPATDVFGLGVVLYECAAGRYAFTGANQAALMAKVVFGFPVPLDRQCPEAPEDLVLLIEWMLAKNPAERPLDGNAAAGELAKLPPMPPGPRRPFRTDDEGRTDANIAHCIVIATSGHPDEVSEPPSPDIALALIERASQLEGEMQIIATGAVVGHFKGDNAELKQRAARWAEQVRKYLPAWHVVVSAPEHDLARAADHCGRTIAANVIAAMFNKKPT
jgi:serine/threonine protein kinase